MQFALKPILFTAGFMLVGLTIIGAGPGVRSPDAMATKIKVLLPDGEPHLTANVRVDDLIGDGSSQIFAAEPMRNQVTWIKNEDEVIIFTEGLIRPVRTNVSDIDNDGDMDLLVADIGELFPSDERVGQVILFRNIGSLNFVPVVILDDVGRVTCAEAADLDSDGDQDIAVCVFGHINEGKILWLEQKENFVFEEHVLDTRPGAIHIFPFDADLDGDLDLSVSLSQLSEEILLFKNNGNGEFIKEVLFKAKTEDYGMSGIYLSDLDNDGDSDILFTNGDEGDKVVKGDPYEFHGLSWLENDGQANFTHHEIIRQWGAYAVVTTDLDNDGDTDIVLANHQVALWHPKSELQRLIWLENDGLQNFKGHKVNDAPTNMLTIDITKDDQLEKLVGGSFNRCSLVNTDCANVGHRLVSFTIQPGVFRDPSAPLVGEQIISKPMPIIGMFSLVILLLGISLVWISKDKRQNSLP